MSNPSVTRGECEAILAKESWLICNKCGWHGPYAEDHSRSGPTSCPYDPIETAHFEKRLARAYLALLDSAKEAELSLRAEIRGEEQYHDAAYSKLNNKLEQTIQAAEKLAEALKNIADGDVIPYANIANAALAQYAAARRGK